MHESSWFSDLSARDVGKYSVERDSSDSTWILRCARCGVVDITPFNAEIESAKITHDRFHEWVLTLANAHPPKWPATLQEILEYGFSSTLFDDDRVENDFRLTRLNFWKDRISESVAPEEGGSTND